MRDKRCLVTGQAAVSRARGGNFTRLEVAHIFPLMAVDNVITDFPHYFIHLTCSKCSRTGQIFCRHLLKNKFALVKSQIVLTMLFFSERMFIVYLMTINGAYGYVNYITYSVFWSSLQVEQGKPQTIVRFEKSGAAVLEQYETVDFSPSSLNTTPAPHMELLMEHLRVALLIHVRGVGKRAVSGFNATVF